MRKNFLQSMKEIFRDWDLKVMSYVMLVVTATCVITATVAWFTCSAYASVRNMEIQTASAEVIKVAVKTGGEDVDVIRADGKEPQVTITMPVFTNVTKSGANTKVLAPGTYGTCTLYVTPLRSDIKGCKILPSFMNSKDSEAEQEWITYMDNVSEEDKEVIEQLVKGHILFFSKCDNGTYSGLLTEEKPLGCQLEWDNHSNEGKESAITIYWYWPYEYEDLPDGVETQLDGDMIFDPEKAMEDKYTDSRLYDFADTKIGLNVKSVKFHFEVSAVYE